MNESEDRLSKFYKVVEEEMARRMVDLDEKIKISQEMGDIATLSDLLIEANGLINLACGEDEELYETWRYRLIYDPENGDIHVFQGEEIDVDVRMWTELGDIFDDDEDGFESDEDDEDDNTWGRIEPWK